MVFQADAQLGVPKRQEEYRQIPDEKNKGRILSRLDGGKGVPRYQRHLDGQGQRWQESSRVQTQGRRAVHACQPAWAGGGARHQTAHRLALGRQLAQRGCGVGPGSSLGLQNSAIYLDHQD